MFFSLGQRGNNDNQKNSSMGPGRERRSFLYVGADSVTVLVRSTIRLPCRRAVYSVRTCPSPQFRFQIAVHDGASAFPVP